jgi:hypothetical protein
MTDNQPICLPWAELTEEQFETAVSNDNVTSLSNAARRRRRGE